MAKLRYDERNKQFDVENPKVDAFLIDIVKVFRKHDMSIAHEDSQGGFIIESFRESNVKWLDDAAFNLEGA